MYIIITHVERKHPKLTRLIELIGKTLQIDYLIWFKNGCAKCIRFFKPLEENIIATYQNNSNKNISKKESNGDLVNENIRFQEVLVIGPNGEQLGTMNRFAAQKKADEYGLDLYCVAPKATPPVCKIINYGKFRFEAQKKAKEAKKKQHTIEIKEIQLTPQIGLHDLETKAKAAKKFLEDGNKVKVGVRFKGRQLSHAEIGDETLNKFLEYVKDCSVVEKKPLLEGKWLTCVLSSKK